MDRKMLGLKRPMGLLGELPDPPHSRRHTTQGKTTGDMRVLWDDGVLMRFRGVVFDPQTATSEQKAQVKDNIARMLEQAERRVAVLQTLQKEVGNADEYWTW
jgi:ribosomal protein S3AE